MGEAAARDRRWPHTTAAHLFPVLSSEAMDKPTSEADVVLDAGWHWRALEDGVVVSMRTVELRHGAYRYELRLAADPSFPDWDGRLAGLLREIGVRIADGFLRCPFPGALWYPLEPRDRDEGKQAARYVSLLTGETVPPDRWIRAESEPDA